jgi:hypothetical protein
MNRAINSTAKRQTLFALGFLFATTWAGTGVASEEQVEHLAWLAGHWRAEDEGVRHEEVWIPPAGGVMLGLHREVGKEGGVFFEFLRIAETESGVFYFAQPLGHPAVGFRLVRSSTQRVVFENPEHDYPQRILYWLDEEGFLRARVEGRVGGEERSSEWRWKPSD